LICIFVYDETDLMTVSWILLLLTILLSHWYCYLGIFLSQSTSGTLQELSCHNIWLAR
jgi:hypothetical protein